MNPGALEQHARAVADVLPQVAEPLAPARSAEPRPVDPADLTTDAVDVAQPLASRGACLRLAHAAPHVVAHQHLEVEADLLLRLLEGVPSEETGQPTPAGGLAGAQARSAPGSGAAESAFVIASTNRRQPRVLSLSSRRPAGVSP